MEKINSIGRMDRGIIIGDFKNFILSDNSNKRRGEGVVVEARRIARDLCFYLCYLESNVTTLNLFNNNIFDPVDFAKTMGYSSYRLFDIIEPDASEGYQTLIGQIIRKLGDAIPFKRDDQLGAWNGFMTVVVKSAFLTGKKSKAFYEVDLNPSFKKNINRFYFYMNLAHYKALKSKRSSALQDLYVYLVQLKTKILGSEEAGRKLAEGGKITTTLGFDFLVTYLGIKEDLIPAKKKQELIKAFNKVNEQDPELSAYLSFKKAANAKFSYVPVITFEGLALPTDYQIAVNNIDLIHNAVADAWLQFYKEKLGLTILSLEEGEVFRRWYKNEKEDADKKARLFCDVYNELQKKKITPMDYICRQYLKDQTLPILQVKEPLPKKA